MKKSERIALDTFLSDWPKNKDIFEVLELIENEDDSIVIWEPFENYQPSFVCEQIENLSCHLLSEYGE